jgi:hypothetical protein
MKANIAVAWLMAQHVSAGSRTVKMLSKRKRKPWRVARNLATKTYIQQREHLARMAKKRLGITGIARIAQAYMSALRKRSTPGK